MQLLEMVQPFDTLPFVANRFIYLFIAYVSGQFLRNLARRSLHTYTLHMIPFASKQQRDDSAKI